MNILEVYQHLQIFLVSVIVVMVIIVMVGEDDNGQVVIIENQLTKSDHDHLGKLITYLTAIEAKVAIWIVSDPRPEHVGAIGWLNESSPAAFYLLKLEAIKIGDSTPAPGERQCVSRLSDRAPSDGPTRRTGPPWSSLRGRRRCRRC